MASGRHDVVARRRGGGSSGGRGHSGQQQRRDARRLRASRAYVVDCRERGALANDTFSIPAITSFRLSRQLCRGEKLSQNLIELARDDHLGLIHSAVRLRHLN